MYFNPLYKPAAMFVYMSHQEAGCVKLQQFTAQLQGVL